ncbi:hypothetical protein GGR95_000930 [Sulfitobacter undariae]|uniref:Immunity MXAN-0049 protein domain-containing protein n=1 Tax=Sulfitobacter undariae TaxID=1563671 RepID=A0A7W6GZT0_9RHOB|nr:DUF1629 domain-containing protein [Sulfitobacter undariae]MBB3993302.1 hypothetical protein [Sulfitobacter undariae]
MPYLLLSNTFTNSEIQWDDVWRRDERPPEYVELGSSHGQVPALSGPIPYRMYKGRLLSGGVLPDITAGRWANDTIISARVKALIEDLDPVTHHFIPLNLTLKDGRQVDGEFFLFVAGDMIDGIIADKSDTTPIVYDGRLAYYSVPGHPHITWRRDAIENRAIWVDKYLSTQICISDELFGKFSRLKLKRFDTVLSVASD